MKAIAAAALSLTSVGAVLSQLYGVMPMHRFALFVMLPSMAGLAAMAVRDPRIARGAWAGLWATIAYDLVRVPFAMSGYYVFKGMPAFGIWLTDGASDTLATDAIGWLYHFSNGVTFGIVYAVFAQRAVWAWGIFYGLALEAAMLATRFGQTFEINLDPRVYLISIGAHLIFGAVLGLMVQFPRMIRPGWMSAAALACLSIGLAVDLARDERPASPAPATVEIRAIRFAPNWIRVKAGQPVRWVNTLDESVELWSKGQFDSLIIPPRGTVEKAFPQALVCEFYRRGTPTAVEGYAIVDP